MANVTVRLIGIAPLLADNVRPAANGTFSFPRVRPGRYTLCLSETTGAYVDPCVWTPLPAVVNVVSAKAETGVKMIALRATTLNVRVLDPGNLVDSRTAEGQQRMLALAACLPNGMIWPMAQVGRDAGGRDFRVTVGEGAPVRFKSLTPFLEVEDHTGAAIHGNAGPESFRGDASRAGPAALTFRVRAAVGN